MCFIRRPREYLILRRRQCSKNLPRTHLLESQGRAPSLGAQRSTIPLIHRLLPSTLHRSCPSADGSLVENVAVELLDLALRCWFPRRAAYLLDALFGTPYVKTGTTFIGTGPLCACVRQYLPRCTEHPDG